MAIALLVRLALFPLASQDTNDPAARVFIAWRWAEDPFLFLHGRWPTLHFILLGPIIKLFDDPIVAPVLLNIVIGSLVPVVLARFAFSEFHDRAAALMVGLAYALYPVGILTSLEVLAQPLFSLCLASTLLALSHSRGSGGTTRHAAWAGLGLTAAASLRAEGLILAPFLALALWPRIRRAIVFLAVAAIGPAAALVANTIHYGDPFYQINAAASIPLYEVGQIYYPLRQHLLDALLLVGFTISGVTPLLALCCGAGALACLVRRRRQAVWLLPLLGIAGALVASAGRGSILPKAIYTETFGVLLIPYLAAFLTLPMMRPLSATAKALINVALVASMVVLLAIGTARDIPGMRERSRLVAAIPAVSPVPTFRGRQVLDRLLPVLQEQGRAGGALVVDALESPATFYLGLHSGYHPSRVYLVLGQPIYDLDARLPAERRPLRERLQPLRDNELGEIDEFLLRHCAGLLVLQPGSRFSSWIGFHPPGAATVRGVDLTLTELARIPWPLPRDARLRGPGVPESAPGELLILRYAVAGCAAPPDGPGARSAAPP